MHLTTLIEMVESGLGDRALVGRRGHTQDGQQLANAARRVAAAVAENFGAVIYVGENSSDLPAVLFGAAWAGVPFVPINYRLEDHQLVELIERTGEEWPPAPLVLADEHTAARLIAMNVRVQVLDSWIADLDPAAPAPEPAWDDEQVAIVLYTSGTTAAPKAALLRHRHLMAYLFGTVEFAGAGDDEATLVTVPPYHIAGMANLLSNVFAGRRVVYLDHFDADVWATTATAEAVSHAMVVPTMLARIVDAIDHGSPAPVNLRSLSYGGSKVSVKVLERALDLLPTTGFVNAYGLTETSSTVAVLGPEDHRTAVASDDPAIRRRLTSAGQIVPSVEAEVRSEVDDTVLPAGSTGILYLRGEQIAGEYKTGSVLDSDGWFCTRDRAMIDADGYLYIEGRADDTIIRGGENIAPAEIEDVIMAHPAIDQVCVVGVPDEEWGQRLVAAVVFRDGEQASADELAEHVRHRLRGSKTPERFVVRDSLPHTPTGKMLRRVVQDELS
ncbi:MAG TPA: fatty acid--CoA ligase family protein, partial [Ilumatobacteraceae bacterium]|nr:fatty acid--CoA ligase family protein [Ilumatobacteraceae bacterium]